MLKISGALLIAIAAIALGRLLTAGLLKHRLLLTDLQQGFLLLEKEIAFMQNPLPLALNLAAKGAGSAADIFAKTAKILSENLGVSADFAWEQALKPHQARLNPDEYADLLAFGLNLGLSDSKHQLKCLELIRLKMASAEKKAIQKHAEQAKVYKSLVIACALALILLLV